MKIAICKTNHTAQALARVRGLFDVITKIESINKLKGLRKQETILILIFDGAEISQEFVTQLATCAKHILVVEAVANFQHTQQW